MTRRWVVLLLALAACGDGGGGPPDVPPDPPTANVVEIVSGNNQVDTVGQLLTVPIRVRVLDSLNVPVRGQHVNFTVLTGGGSVFGGSAFTDSLGEVVERWTLGTLAGAQRLRAGAVDQDTGDTLAFAVLSATALPGPVTTLTLRRADTVAFVGVGTDVRGLVQSAADGYGNAVSLTGRTPAITGTGAYTAVNGVITPTAEANLSLTLVVENGSAALAVRARRDIRTLTGLTGSYGCRNAWFVRLSPSALEQRHGMFDWQLLQYDATARVDSVTLGGGPFDPTVRYDAVVWVTHTVFGSWKKWQGTITDTLTQVIHDPIALHQFPDSVVFRRTNLINGNSPPSFGRWVGNGLQGADWCSLVERTPYYAAFAIFEGTDGQFATAGSFLPVSLAP